MGIIIVETVDYCGDLCPDLKCYHHMKEKGSSPRSDESEIGLFWRAKVQAQ